MSLPRGRSPQIRADRRSPATGLQNDEESATPWEKLSSSNVDSIRYLPGPSFLEVRFLDGKVYRYENVPVHLYEAMRYTQSPGRFVHAVLKGKFPSTKLT